MALAPFWVFLAFSRIAIFVVVAHLDMAETKASSTLGWIIICGLPGFCLATYFDNIWTYISGLYSFLAISEFPYSCLSAT
ncbi:MAG TPA: hypothetical protein VJZ78_07035 [Anaerolineales bacterium]|nr:hypothetical protein [Anaerolineales bacterium]